MQCAEQDSILFRERPYVCYTHINTHTSCSVRSDQSSLYVGLMLLKCSPSSVIRFYVHPVYPRNKKKMRNIVLFFHLNEKCLLSFYRLQSILMSQCGVCRENPRVDWFTINLSFTETFSLTPGWIFFRRMKVELRQKMMYV